MKKFFRIIFVITILLECAGSLGFLPIAQDFTWLGLLITFVFSWAMLELFRFPLFIWVLVFLFLILDVFSALLGLYSTISSWDKLMHTCGGALIATGALEIVLQLLKKEYIRTKYSKLFIIINVFFSVIFLGFLYEFWEYLVDKFQYGYVKSLVNVYNSIEDQLFNMLGTILVLIIYFLWQRYKDCVNLNEKIKHKKYCRNE